MKTLILFVSIIFCLNSVILGQNSGNPTNGLVFSKAFFISLSSNELKNFVAVDTTFIIESGKVWNVTSTKSFMLKENFTSYENEVNLWINDQIINFYKSPFDCPLWLPEGKYRIRLTSFSENRNFRFIGYISGVEYSIIK